MLTIKELYEYRETNTHLGECFKSSNNEILSKLTVKVREQVGKELFDQYQGEKLTEIDELCQMVYEQGFKDALGLLIDSM